MLITDDAVIIGTDTSTGHVYAFDKAEGDVLWKHEVRGEGAASDILWRESLIYTVTLADELLCLHATSGELVWAL